MTDTVDVTTYCDDKSLGQVAPSIDSLELVRGDKVTIEAGKITVVYFFTTFYKGAYPVNEEFTVLAEKFTDVVFVAVSNDAEKEKLERFLGKEIVDENTKAPIRMGVKNVLYDAGKHVGKTYADVSNLAIMSCPAAYIVDGEGKIAWRQQFLQTFTVKDSNFEAQLKHVLAGEAVESAGPRPKVEVDEGEVAEVDGDIALF